MEGRRNGYDGCGSKIEPFWLGAAGNDPRSDLSTCSVVAPEYALVSVLNGEMTLEEKGNKRIVRAGESWTENLGDPHSVVKAGTTTARVVVNMLLPRGAEATTLIKK